MKRLAIAILGGVAAAPVAFLYACAKPNESPSVIDASISADPVVASSSSAPGMAAPPTAVIASAVASTSTTTASAPSKRQTCEALQQKVRSMLATGGACTTAADCEIVQTGCGLAGQCGEVVAKTHKPDVKKTSDLFYAKNCLDVLPPQACATCPMPPTPKCVNGQCN